MAEELTDKQQVFVCEYLKDMNATQAAIRAGYSAKNADSYAAQLISKPKVSRAIEEALEARKERTQVTQDYVVKGLMEVAERCLQRKPVMEFDRTERRMVQAKDDEGRDLWCFDSQGANRAFELLGKHLGIFLDKKEITGKDGGPVEIKTLAEAMIAESGVNVEPSQS